MARIGGLSMLFRAEEEEELRRSQLALANERPESAAASAKLLGKEKNNIKKPESSGFRMPLHYPSYTKTQYENMSEWEIDVLLKLYGLFVDGDFRYKKDFAMNAFLWDLPEEISSTTDPSTSGSTTCRDVIQLQESSTTCSGLVEKSRIAQGLMVFFSVLGFS